MKGVTLDDLANPLQTLADIAGPEAGKIVGAGLAMGTAAQMIAAFVAPALAAGVGAVGMLTGMLLQYLRGRHQKKAALAMAGADLTPDGPAYICGEHASEEFQAVQQQTMENRR